MSTEQKKEAPKEEKKEKETPLPHRVNQLIAAIIGTILAWAMTTQVGIDAVLSSAAVALCGGILTKKYHGIVMAGSFAGMSSLAAVPAWYWAVIVGVIVFVLWVGLEKMMAGVGGKYGFLACISGFLAQFIIKPITGGDWSTLFFTPAVWQAWFVGATGAYLINIPLCILLSVIGAVATLWARDHLVTPKMGGENTTIASALVGIIGYAVCWGIAMTMAHSVPPPAADASAAEISKYNTGLTVVAAEAGKLGAFIYMGSFVGMASKSRVRKGGQGNIPAFAIAGAVAGVLFLATRFILPYGGLYGFTAAIAVMIYDFLIAGKIFKEKPHELRTFAAIQK